ncbi:MAG: heme exporter protein CcmD [Gammaproteobacteria bacterium]|nr:heme exporter protein CcmD [Gammaproteobacteria bacterium]MDH5630923.1 heme exporter protein CcmD [Gammaproteobacteria bacterium]
MAEILSSLDFGKHNFYIWTSYALALIVFVILFLMVKSQNKSLTRQLKRQHTLESVEHNKETSKAEKK